MTLGVYLVEDAERHWFVAEHDGDAFALYRTMYNEDAETKADVEITRLADDDPLTIDSEDGEKETKTAAEWAKEGRGFLASTCY